MKYFSIILCLLILYPSCATKTKKITITTMTPLSPINMYLLDAVTGNPDPALVETSADQMETHSIWADGLQAIIKADFKGKKIVYNFNNGVVLVMKPNLEQGFVECQFDNGEAFIIRNE